MFRIRRFLAVCLVLLGIAISIPTPALASRPGADSNSQTKQEPASVESQRQSAAKLEIPTGGGLGRQQVKDVFEAADTRTAKETLDEARKISPQIDSRKRA